MSEEINVAGMKESPSFPPYLLLSSSVLLLQKEGNQWNWISIDWLLGPVAFINDE